MSAVPEDIAMMTAAPNVYLSPKAARYIVPLIRREIDRLTGESLAQDADEDTAADAANDAAFLMAVLRGWNV